VTLAGGEGCGACHIHIMMIVNCLSNIDLYTALWYFIEKHNKSGKGNIAKAPLIKGYLQIISRPANNRKRGIHMKQKMEDLRQEINRMVATGKYNETELIKKSQELDKYIVHTMKESLRAYTKLHHNNISGIRVIIKNIKKIHHMYDSIRIVDPFSKELLCVLKEYRYHSFYSSTN
jgi:hypothetical protein